MAINLAAYNRDAEAGSGNAVRRYYPCSDGPLPTSLCAAYPTVTLSLCTVFYCRFNMNANVIFNILTRFTQITLIYLLFKRVSGITCMRVDPRIDFESREH